MVCTDICEKGLHTELLVCGLLLVRFFEHCHHVIILIYLFSTGRWMTKVGTYACLAHAGRASSLSVQHRLWAFLLELHRKELATPLLFAIEQGQVPSRPGITIPDEYRICMLRKFKERALTSSFLGCFLRSLLQATTADLLEPVSRASGVGVSIRISTAHC